MRLPPFAAFGVCVAVWGGSWYAIRAAVEGADPIGIAALRASMATVLLGLLALAMRLPRPGRAGALRALGVGLVLIGANFALVFWGATRVPSGLAALLYATTPLQAALIAAASGVDRARWRTLGAAGLALGGVALAFAAPGAWAGLSWAGVLAVLLGATASAGGSVMARRWNTLHPVWLAVLAHLSASLVLWTHYALLGEAAALPRSPQAWTGFLYMVVGASVVAFLAYFTLLREWDAARASFATLATPFVTLALGALAFAQPIRPAEWLGCALVLAAGYLAMASPSAAAARRISAARNLLSPKYARR